MLRTIFWLTWLVGYFISCLPTKWKAIRLGKQGKTEERKKLIEKRVGHWGRLLLRYIKVDVTVEGKENLPEPGKTVVFVSNHQSYMDIPILLGYLDKPHALMAKSQLGKIPFLSAWMRLLGCIFVEREDARAAVASMRQAEETLQRGDSLIICPEGTRSKSDTLNEFKAGAVRIAVKAGVDVVPVAIDGSYRALEGSGWKLTKCKVRLVILPAVPTKDLDRASQKELPKKLKDMVRAAKDAR